MPDKRHTYTFPTWIEYGPGSVQILPNIIKKKGYKRGLLVTDDGLDKVGIPSKLKEYFTQLGIKIDIFTDVKSNPTDENCYEGARVFRETRSEFVVGLGGGSPLDVGKVVCLLATHDVPLEIYDDTQGGADYIKNNMPPFFAIPTTAGTGSEVGRSSVITMKSTNKKTIIFSPYFMPSIAILDAGLTVSLPPKLTAATGVDALVHSLEPFIISAFHPFADGIAREGIYRAYRHLPIAFKSPEDLCARGEMLMASAMGATAFQKGLGLNHSIAHALGAIYDMHHGLANAAVLIEVMKFNLLKTYVSDRLASLGETLNTENDAEAVIEALETWLVKLDMPTDLKNQNIKEDDLQKIEDYVFEDPCCSLNPRKVEKGNVVNILQKLI